MNVACINITESPCTAWSPQAPRGDSWWPDTIMLQLFGVPLLSCLLCFLYLSFSLCCPPCLYIPSVLFFVCGLPVAGSCLDLDSHNSHSLADNPTVRESVLSCHTESFPNRSSCHVQNGFEGILGKHRLMATRIQTTAVLFNHASSGFKWSCLSSTASARDEHCDLHL